MKLIFLFLLMNFSIESSSQTILTWSDLEKGIFWEKNSFKDYPGFFKANFSSRLNELEGKEITLTGYLLVLGGKQSLVMLSKNPMASCFFCGNGGPETIAEIEFSQQNSFKMDDVVTITGTLRLNGDDPTSCYYRIEQANGFVL